MSVKGLLDNRCLNLKKKQCLSKANIYDIKKYDLTNYAEINSHVKSLRVCYFGLTLLESPHNRCLGRMMMV